MGGSTSGSFRWLAGMLAAFCVGTGAGGAGAAEPAEPAAWTLDPPEQHRVSAPALARLREQLQQSEPMLVVPTHQVVIVALTDPDDWAPEKSAANTAKLLRERVVPAIAD